MPLFPLSNQHHGRHARCKTLPHSIELLRHCPGHGGAGHVMALRCHRRSGAGLARREPAGPGRCGLAAADAGLVHQVPGLPTGLPGRLPGSGSVLLHQPDPHHHHHERPVAASLCRCPSRGADPCGHRRPAGLCHVPRGRPVARAAYLQGHHAHHLPADGGHQLRQRHGHECDAAAGDRHPVLRRRRAVMDEPGGGHPGTTAHGNGRRPEGAGHHRHPAGARLRGLQRLFRPGCWKAASP